MPARHAWRRGEGSEGGGWDARVASEGDTAREYTHVLTESGRAVVVKAGRDLMVRIRVPETPEATRLLGKRAAGHVPGRKEKEKWREKARQAHGPLRWPAYQPSFRSSSS